MIATATSTGFRYTDTTSTAICYDDDTSSTDIGQEPPPAFTIIRIAPVYHDLTEMVKTWDIFERAKKAQARKNWASIQRALNSKVKLALGAPPRPRAFLIRKAPPAISGFWPRKLKGKIGK